MLLKPFAALLICLAMLSQQPGSAAVVNRNNGVFMALGLVRENTVADGLRTRECLVVNSDRSFHLERRVQRMPQTGNDVEIYEGTMDADQFDVLAEMLDDPGVESLPDYISPQLPISTYVFDMLTLDYTTDHNVRRRLGYFSPLGQLTPGTSPANTPDKVKDDWLNSKSVLQPFISWLDGFEGRGLTRVTDNTRSCVDY